jgi:hypothetical protein
MVRRNALIPPPSHSSTAALNLKLGQSGRPPSPPLTERLNRYIHKGSLGEAPPKSRPRYHAQSTNLPQRPRTVSRKDPRLIVSEGQQGIQSLMRPDRETALL